MKKFLKKIFGGISAFIIGAQTKVFAANQTSVYGPAPDVTINTNQTTVYGPPPTSSVNISPTVPPTGGEAITPVITGAQILSIIASILLFIIGIIVILNKKISKKVKIIVSSIIVVLIAALISFCIFFN